MQWTFHEVFQSGAEVVNQKCHHYKKVAFASNAYKFFNDFVTFLLVSIDLPAPE